MDEGGERIVEMAIGISGNNLIIFALCPYVLAQFKRHPGQYGDIWGKEWPSWFLFLIISHLHNTDPDFTF